MYKLQQGGIQRLSDNSLIPLSEGNRDYVEYLHWLEKGNTPEPADVLPKVYRRFTVREFLALFTQEEKLAVKVATRSSDTVGLWYDEMLVSDYISLEDPATEQGLHVLFDANLLTSERLGEIVEGLK